MKAVELFSGIGGFRIAADSLGLRTIWANDNAKKACLVYRDRFGSEELVEGDIWALLQDIPRHEVLTAGFPCQPFSSAGKKKGIDDPRGTLFQAIIDVLLRRQPKYFLLENVKRLLSMHSGRHFATILDGLSEAGYFVEWRLLNATNFGLPQSRERVFVAGVREDLVGTEVRLRLVGPGDLHPKLEAAARDLRDTRISKLITEHGEKFKAWGIAANGRYFHATPKAFGQTRPRTTLGAVLDDDVDPSFDFTEDSLERIKKSEFVNRYYNGVQLLWNQGGGARMGYTIFGTEGVAPTLTASTSRHYERYYINGRYRRLTNYEYARIQGFPDDHCQAATVYDQYALLGNAVPPAMARWALDELVHTPAHRIAQPQQQDLFCALRRSA